MQRVKIVRGDKVLIIVGKDRLKVGTVERVLPKTNQVVVTGLNIVKKHLKKSPKNPQGGIIDLAKPLHISNVMVLDPTSNKPTRVGFRITGKTKERVSKLTSEALKQSEKK